MVHKAFIEVNEEGSEAVAATAVMMDLCCYWEPNKFRVDHPFVFAIRDNRSKAVLFLGRMVDPSK